MNIFEKSKSEFRDFPGGLLVKKPPANAGDTGSFPGLEDSTCHETTKPVYHNY